jgi:nucleotide-binding universal stress UspA family protein
MKILIGISSKEYSEPTLDVGMRIASILKSATTILDVGKKINEFSYKDVSIANELIDKGNGRFEVFLKGIAVKNLSLILRNGDIIEELRDEVQSFNYDLTIIGGSGKRSMAHDLIQYIDSSIFVVNNFNQKQKYRILLAVDDSPGTSKTVKLGVRVAQAFNIEVDLITITNEKEISDKYHNASSRAEKMMRRSGVKSKVKFIKGELVNTLVEVAGDNHIIIMGTSSQSPLSKFFLGSKPLDVMESCNCPMLIVK